MRSARCWLTNADIIIIAGALEASDHWGRRLFVRQEEAKTVLKTMQDFRPRMG
jgi:hypothetical protein